MESPQKELDKVRNPWKLFMKPGLTHGCVENSRQGCSSVFFVGSTTQRNIKIFKMEGVSRPSIENMSAPVHNQKINRGF